MDILVILIVAAAIWVVSALLGLVVDLISGAITFVIALVAVGAVVLYWDRLVDQVRPYWDEFMSMGFL